MTDTPETPGERVYYHGRMSLFCALLTIAAVLVTVHVWRPGALVAFLAALHTGYHLGRLLVSLSAKPAIIDHIVGEGE